MKRPHAEVGALRALGLASALVLAGCANGPALQAASYQPGTAPVGADGWFKSRTYWFKGPLVGGVPHGTGECRTQYAAKGQSGTEWVDAPCEFSHGQRVDARHLARLQGSIERFREVRVAEQEEEQRQADATEARNAQRAAESRRAFNEGMRDSVLRINEQARQMGGVLAQADRQASTAVSNAQAAMAQRQEEAFQAARERQARADEEARTRRDQAQAREDATLAQRRAEAQRLKAQADAEEAARREAAEKAARDRAMREEEARRIKEKADRDAARKAEQEAEERADAQYLRDLLAGTRLHARKCPSPGYYIVGLLPKIKPERVQCVDLHYSARCEGSPSATTGVGRNFVGLATDCFMGDTYEIKPTPSCPVDKVVVTAVELRRCGQ
jgi:hypothetical protein